MFKIVSLTSNSTFHSPSSGARKKQHPFSKIFKTIAQLETNIQNKLASENWTLNDRHFQLQSMQFLGYELNLIILDTVMKKRTTISPELFIEIRNFTIRLEALQMFTRATFPIQPMKKNPDGGPAHSSKMWHLPTAPLFSFKVRQNVVDIRNSAAIELNQIAWNLTNRFLTCVNATRDAESLQPTSRENIEQLITDIETEQGAIDTKLEDLGSLEFGQRVIEYSCRPGLNGQQRWYKKMKSILTHVLNERPTSSVEPKSAREGKVEDEDLSCFNPRAFWSKLDRLFYCQIPTPPLVKENWVTNVGHTIISAFSHRFSPAPLILAGYLGSMLKPTGHTESSAHISHALGRKIAQVLRVFYSEFELTKPFTMNDASLTLKTGMLGDLSDKKDELTVKGVTLDVGNVIGIGAYGTVYRLSRQDNYMPDTQVLKVLDGTEADKTRDSNPEQFNIYAWNEAVMGSSIYHPNVARCLSFLSTNLNEKPERKPGYVFENAGQVELYNALYRKEWPNEHDDVIRALLPSNIRDLSENSRIFLMWQLIDTVLFLHERHHLYLRDIKPENIMIDTKDGVPYLKIVDLGMAKLIKNDRFQARGETRLFETRNSIAGTARYINMKAVKSSAQTEQKKGTPRRCIHPSDAQKHDSFSVARVLYEIIRRDEDMEIEFLAPTPLLKKVKGYTKAFETSFQKFYDSSAPADSGDCRPFDEELQIIRYILRGQTLVELKTKGVLKTLRPDFCVFGNTDDTGFHT